MMNQSAKLDAGSYVEGCGLCVDRWHGSGGTDTGLMSDLLRSDYHAAEIPR